MAAYVLCRFSALNPSSCCRCRLGRRGDRQMGQSAGAHERPDQQQGQQRDMGLRKGLELRAGATAGLNLLPLVNRGGPAGGRGEQQQQGDRR